MPWGAVVRVAIFAFLATALVVSLLGIVLTGPVVVRVERLQLDFIASPDRIREHVESLCNDFFPRDAAHPDNLDRAADWIAERLSDTGFEVDMQEYPVLPATYRNVVGKRQGRDPSLGAYVVGAHYDAYPGTPGADDNASGVAAMIELAETLPRTAPERTLYFVAFSTHEPPHSDSAQMGSRVFADSLVSATVPVDLMISLDMVGYFSDERGSQRYPWPGFGLFSRRRGDFIAILGDLDAGPWIETVKRGMMRVDSIPVQSLRLPRAWMPIDVSDHLSFRELDLPGVHVTDTAFMRHPHYHVAEDTADLLDYARIARLVEALHGVLHEGAIF